LIVKQQTDSTFDMVVVTNGERGKHPDFIKSVFLGMPASPQQSRSLASKMLEPIVKTRSIELLSYILYIIGRGARPLFALQQALCMRHCQDGISLRMSLKTLKPTPLYSIKVYAYLSFLQSKDSKPPFLVTRLDPRICISGYLESKL
jgi:hypothetical protein